MNQTQCMQALVFSSCLWLMVGCASQASFCSGSLQRINAPPAADLSSGSVSGAASGSKGRSDHALPLSRP